MTPFVSPFTRFEAADRKTTHFGASWKSPSTATLNDGPFAGWPFSPREGSSVFPAFHLEPLLSIVPPRLIAKTS